MFNRKKKEKVPEGMISTEDLAIGITGAMTVSEINYIELITKYFKADVVMVHKMRNKNENDTSYIDIFTGTIYTYRKTKEPYNINYILPLPLTQKFITDKEAKEIYLKAREMFHNSKKSPAQNKAEEKSKNTESRPKKSKLRQRRYID